MHIERALPALREFFPSGVYRRAPATQSMITIQCVIDWTRPLLFTHLWRWHCGKRGRQSLQGPGCVPGPHPTSAPTPPPSALGVLRFHKSLPKTTEERHSSLWAFDPLKCNYSPAQYCPHHNPPQPTLSLSSDGTVVGGVKSLAQVIMRQAREWPKAFI